MKRYILLSASFALAGLLLGAGLAPPARAQVLRPASINFRNDTPIPIIVQGVSIIGGTLRKGQPIFIPPAKNAWDTNVPPGPRQYRVYDGAMPSRVLNPNVSIQVLHHDLFLRVRLLPGGTVDVVPDIPGKR